jgi:hypothetical protein
MLHICRQGLLVIAVTDPSAIALAMRNQSCLYSKYVPPVVSTDHVHVIRNLFHYERNSPCIQYVDSSVTRLVLLMER